MGPVDPRTALVMQRVAIVLLVLVIALAAGLAILVVFAAPNLGWGLLFPILVGVLALGVSAASAVGPMRAAAANLRQHLTGVDEHRCQCAICARSFTPAKDSPTAPVARIPIPQERLASTNAAARGFGVALVVTVVGAALYFVLGFHRERLLADGSSNTLFVLFFAVLAVMFILAGLLALIAKRAAERQLARAPSAHVCTCRWCGRSERRAP